MTAAYMQILIHAVNGSLFPGADPGAIAWTGPPPEIITVQSLLYASLATSLFAAFLAMLGKQWVNRYLRNRGGSAAEKSRDRQQKLDGLQKWHFHIAIESLPVMLQLALLLLGCALSQYLWTISRTVAGVTIAVTVLGVTLCLLHPRSNIILRLPLPDTSFDSHPNRPKIPSGYSFAAITHHILPLNQKPWTDSRVSSSRDLQCVEEPPLRFRHRRGSRANTTRCYCDATNPGLRGRSHRLGGVQGRHPLHLLDPRFYHRH